MTSGPTPEPPRTTTVSNGCEHARIGLSILVPTYRHDPAPLIHALGAIAPADGVELVIYDDGACDPALVAAIADALHGFPAPARLIVADANRGRAHARNALIAAARGRHVLLLDADMAPPSRTFLAAWLALIDAENPGVAFGGFTVAGAPPAPRTGLHRYLAQRAECHRAEARSRDPARFVATSNLLIRRDVLDRAPFDAAFAGWGWEDVEWALRAADVSAIRHIDNPAIHLGLDTPETLVAKYTQAGPNYRRLASAHPGAMPRFPSWRAARILARARGHARVRPLLAAIARMDVAPLFVRHVALKLFRTSIYADALP